MDLACCCKPETDIDTDFLSILSGFALQIRKNARDMGTRNSSLQKQKKTIPKN